MPGTTRPRSQSKSARIAREALLHNLVILQQESFLDSAIREEIPEAWHTLERDLDVAEKKEKVTLYLDRSVARFYRAMGKGYHARINRLLATWAQMKIAEELKWEKALERGEGDS